MANISLPYSSRASLQAPLASTLATLQQVFGDWRKRARARRELATLDARTLRDLGLTASQIEFEINKPFWRG